MSESKTSMPSAEPQEAAVVQTPPSSGVAGAGAPVSGGPGGPRRKGPNIRRRKTIGRIIGACFALALVAGLIYAVAVVFYSPDPVYYTTDIVRRMDKLSQVVIGGGYAEPVESLELKSEVGGKVLEAYGFEGMPVNEGDPLCVLDSSALDKAIEDIDKEIAAQEAAISKSNETIDKLTKNMNEANAERFKEEKDAVIYAPFSGKIIEVEKQTIGAPIFKGDNVGKLVDDSVMILRQYFTYGYVNDVKTGMKASVSIPVSMTIVEGTVTNVEKVKNIQADGTITFEVEISINNPGALTKDMNATATLASDSGESILPAGSGKLEYRQEEVISAGASGNIKAFNLRNYHEYKKGDLLVEVEYIPDDSEIEGFLDSIKMQRDAIEEAQLKIEEKQTERQEQEALYDKLTITAPISGTLLMFSAYVDQVMDTTTPICNIAQMDRMIIAAEINQSDLQHFEVGMQVEVYQGYDESMPGILGTVKSISLEGKNDYGYTVYPCKIEVDNSMGGLPNSSYVSFRAILAETINPLVASIDVIKPLIDGECVYVQTDERPENAIDLPEGVVPEGFYAVPVTVGITQSILNQERYMYEEVVEITSGVEEGWVLHRQKLNVKPSDSPSPSDEEGIDGPVDGGMDGGDDGVIDDGGIIDGGDMVDDGGLDGGDFKDDGTDGGDVDGGGDSTDDSGDLDGGGDDSLPDDSGEDGSGDSDGSVPDGGGVVVRPMPIPVG